MFEKESGWIGSRDYDLLFFFGSGAFSLVLAGVVLAKPSLIVPLWWAWLLFLDGPHLIATYTRSYIDERDRQKRAKLLWTSLLFLLLGPAILGLDWLLQSPAPFELFLALAALWAWHHAVRQHYGIMAIYQWHAKSPPLFRRLDKIFLYASLWLMFATFTILHPNNRALLELPTEVDAITQSIAIIALTVMVLGTLAYIVMLLVWGRRYKILKPGLFVLIPVFGSQAMAFTVIGSQEPLYPNPTDPEQVFMALSLVAGSVHSVQYLGIIFASNDRRYQSSKDQSFAAWLGRRPFSSYGLMVVLSLLYILLVAARGISPEISLWSASHPLSRLSLALYWGLFFHHYYIDQHIWRVSRDPSLRQELGLISVEP